MTARQSKRARVACAALLVAAAALAGCFERKARLVRPLPTSESILAQASHVARVRVTSRDPIAVPYRRGEVSCGSYYRAEVIERLKGDGSETLDFFTEEALDVAAEYLVAVRDTSLRGPQLDPSTEWDTQRRVRCRVAYERIATGVARVAPGEDGLFVEDARMLPERIRRQEVGGAVPWPVVKRELFAAAPLAAREAPLQEPAAATPAADATEAAPEAPVEPETPRDPALPAPEEENRWLPWNWEFEWL